MAVFRAPLEQAILLKDGDEQDTEAMRTFALGKRTYLYGIRFHFAPRSEQEVAAKLHVRWDRSTPSVDGRAEELAPIDLRPGGSKQSTVWVFDEIDQFIVRGVRGSEAWEIAGITLYVKPSESLADLDLFQLKSRSVTTWLPISGDWDGDGTSSIGLFYSSRGRFYLSDRNVAGKANRILTTDQPRPNLLPFAGDWNGDGIRTPAVFDPQAGMFYLESDAQAVSFNQGLRFGPRDAQWVPLAGDWEGDGDETVGLYNPATSQFLLLENNEASGAVTKFRFGRGGIGWLPVMGDWDGDGRDTVGLYDPKGGKFYLRNSNTAGAGEITLSFGPPASACLPVAGDWNGDGIDTVGLYRPREGRFLLHTADRNGSADTQFRFGPRQSASAPLTQVSRDASVPIPDWPRLKPRSLVELGPGWSSNTINTVIFRHHGLVTRDGYQFGAFYRDSGAIVVFRRDLENGIVLLNELDGEIDLYDAHDTISLGIDGSGRIHMSYPEHSGKLRYRRTREPFSIDAWTPAIPMTGVREDRVTYPTFLMPPGKMRSQQSVVRASLRSGVEEPSLLFLYRDGHSDKGDARLKVFDDRAGTWIDRDTPVLAGAQLTPWTCSPYWNHPVFDAAGRLHLSFVWRTHSLGSQRLVNNRNIDYAVSPDLGATWLTSKGHRLQLPITPVNSETVQAISPGTSLIHQTSSAVDSRGNLHVVFYSEDAGGIPQYQHLWFEGKRWRRSVLSRRTADFELTGGGTLQIPISRPEIVIGSDDTAYVLYRGDLSNNALVAQRLIAPDYKPVEDVRILWLESVGYAEPMIDRTRWKQDGVLSMLVQKNHQPPHDRPVKRDPEPVFLVDWDLENAW